VENNRGLRYLFSKQFTLAPYHAIFHIAIFSTHLPATIPEAANSHGAFGVMTAPTSRLNGLDTLRSLAIAFVFMNHYMVFISHEETFGWASRLGWVGVDPFFVLSGYLIADLLWRIPGRFYGSN
jgi:hypothetical protein